MKQLFTLLFMLLHLAVFAQSKTPRFWTEDQRRYLQELLESSKRELLSEVEKLSEKQVHFKPDTAKWSIAQVVEHLAVQEEHLYWDLLYNQYTPEHPEIACKGLRDDEEFLAYATDAAKSEAPG